ncbi:hypothetical protein E2C01_005796 [Portunus trituberculatus]|uniref:Uncharacterized protein n=1 Tax=Portunus trituberculatus TaxID=210409 RepID=A0A5B7CTB8_PORTR|nr:hypothetical protein [Portunus trituberculatus]
MPIDYNSAITNTITIITSIGDEGGGGGEAEERCQKSGESCVSFKSRCEGRWQNRILCLSKGDMRSTQEGYAGEIEH